MTQIVTSPGKSWPITLGAEGIAAAQFARCGFDVLMQAGRDKPWYDLVVTCAGNLLKVSVKASQDGQWSLTQGYSRQAPEIAGSRFDCLAAIDRWVNSHGARTVCCLVQFEHVALHEMPRIYLAFPCEIAALMREASERLGRCALFEKYVWASADGSRRSEALPTSWLFSQSRIEELLQSTAAATLLPTKAQLVTRVVALSA
jgi:hypothetical protein